MSVRRGRFSRASARSRRGSRRGSVDLHLRVIPQNRLRRACPPRSAISSPLGRGRLVPPPLGFPGALRRPSAPPPRFRVGVSPLAFRAFADVAAATAASPSRSRTKRIHASFGAGRGAALSLVSAFSTSAAKDAHASLTSGGRLDVIFALFAAAPARVDAARRSPRSTRRARRRRRRR